MKNDKDFKTGMLRFAQFCNIDTLYFVSNANEAMNLSQINVKTKEETCIGPVSYATEISDNNSFIYISEETSDLGHIMLIALGAVLYSERSRGLPECRCFNIPIEEVLLIRDGLLPPKRRKQ